MVSLDFIPKKYQERVYSLEREYDLIDDCKYILYFKYGWSWAGYSSLPVKSKKEALEFIKDADREECL